jgi:hypothetical protein
VLEDELTQVPEQVQKALSDVAVSRMGNTILAQKTKVGDEFGCIVVL